MGQLTIMKINSIKEPGRYLDGEGLTLVVGVNGSKSWIARIQVGGRRRDIGLGSYRNVSLKDAREALAATRRQLLDGIDPVAAKRTFKIHQIQAQMRDERAAGCGKRIGQPGRLVMGRAY